MTDTPSTTPGPRTPGPKTLAQAARERRDIVTGEVMDEARLIRFVIGPDGAVVPDLARKLPGRGVWVAAERASVETAARKGLFSRAAKAKVQAPADLAEQVADLLQKRLLLALGLARKSGELVLGFEKVAAAVKAGKAAVVAEALDGAPDGRGKMLVAVRKAPLPPLLIGLYKSDEMGLALGAENVVHSACLAGRTADRWTFDARRLSGFRPLFPESWREEP